MRAELSNSAVWIVNGCMQNVRRWLPHAGVLWGGTSGETQICGGCDADLPRLTGPRCSVCAVPLASGRVCGACLDAPPRYAHVVAAFAYRFPVDALIHAYKY